MDNKTKVMIIDYCRENYLSIVETMYYVEPLLKGRDIKTILNNLDLSQFRTNKSVKELQCSLLNKLHKYEFTGSNKYRLMIEEVEVHSLLEFPITVEEMDNTNELIACYCVERNEKTYESFYNFLLKSKVMKKCNPPLELIETQCTRIAKLMGL